MKTNKITLVSNNFNINKNKLNKRNNVQITSFKGTNRSLPQIGQKTVQSVWSRLFPKLKKGLVKTTYTDIIPTQSNGYLSKEVKYYYRKSKDNLLLKTFRNCKLNKDKQIEKASEISYHYDNDEKKGLQQKIIINPEFDRNNQLKKADCVYAFYTQGDEKRTVIHKNVEFKDDAIISSRSSEFVYNDGTKEYYEDTLINENGEIYNFAKKESLFSYEEGDRIITQKKIWFDSNFTENTPDAYMSTVNSPGEPEKKIYIEEPVFRDDNSIQSSRLGQKVTDGTAYTYYNSTYNEDGCIESSELSRVTNIDAYNKAKKLKETISYMNPLLARNYAQIKDLEERQQELGRKYTELEKQYQDEYELRIKERRRTFYKPTIEPEQKTLGIKDLLKIYENKSEDKEQAQPAEPTKQNQTSSRIKDLLRTYENKSNSKEQAKPVDVTKPKQVSSRIKDLLKIYENKSEDKNENKEQEEPVVTTKPKTILPNVEANKSAEKEEATKSKTTLLLESLKSIEQEKEALQIQIAQLKARHRVNMAKYHRIVDALNELMSQDIVYDRDKDQKIIAKVSASFDNTINENFQFQYKELIDNE